MLNRRGSSYPYEISRIPSRIVITIFVISVDLKILKFGNVPVELNGEI